MENTAGPSILKTSTPPPPPDSKTSKKWFKSNLVKIIIIVLVIGVLAELVYAGYSLFSPSKMSSLNPLSPQVNEITNAQISLVPDKSSYAAGETVVIDVKLFTGGYTTDSTDLVVKYDPQYLVLEGGSNAVTEGQIYSEYPPIQVQEETGLIGMSGITLPDQSPFSGVGTFATLRFKALQGGQTQVMIDYQPQSTGDSNVLLSGGTEDILGMVVNADINIGGAGAVSSNAQSCESFVQSCQDASGASGTQVCTGGSNASGSCGYDPKLTSGCEVCKI